MRETRRIFLLALGRAATYLAGGLTVARAQRTRPFPEPPAPSATNNPADSRQADAAKSSARRAALQRNEREFRAGVERLYELTGELREEVQKTVTTEVLSVRMYRKAEEIERVAKQLKRNARV